MEEMKQGYKQTDIGVIPEDWEVKTICDGIAEVKSGKRLPMGYYVSDTKSEHPYIRVIDMTVGGIDISDIKYVPNEAYPPISNYRIFLDDIFISVAGTLGLVGKIPQELDGANLTENANRLTRINCNRDYLMYYLLSPLIQNVILSEQTIGAQPKLALNRIRNFQIGLPPTIQEQTAIATALSDTDALIAALDKKIAKKQEMKQGAMQQLLTGKKRLPGFSGEWVDKTVGSVCKVKRGQMIVSSEFVTGSIPVIAGGMSPAGYHNASNRNENTITISASGANAGFIGFHKFPIFASDCSTINENENIDIHFIYYTLKLKQEEIYKCQTGGAQPHIHPKDIEPLFLNFPTDKPEQTAIAQILTDMDNEIVQLKKERDKYKDLKAGMMQVLLTGKIRLI